MTTMILLTPYLAFFLGVAMMVKALHLYSEPRLQSTRSREWKRVLLIWTVPALPSLGQAQAVDLRTATESGYAVIMYL
jgi:hypothetical protein